MNCDASLTQLRVSLKKLSKLDVDETSFLSPCTSTIFPISLSALMKFLDTQVLPFPQLPNNTKDK